MEPSKLIPEWLKGKPAENPEAAEPETDEIADADLGEEKAMVIENALQIVIGASKGDLEMVLSFVKDSSDEPYSDPEFARKARSVLKYLLEWGTK